VGGDYISVQTRPDLRFRFELETETWRTPQERNISCNYEDNQDRQG